MAKSKLNLENSNLVWNPERRYKVNEIVTYFGKTYQNLTGKNSEPGVGSDWFVPEYSIFVPYTGAEEDVDLGEFQLKVGQIELDQTPTGTFNVGKVRWNDADGTIKQVDKERIWFCEKCWDKLKNDG